MRGQSRSHEHAAADPCRSASRRSRSPASPPWSALAVVLLSALVPGVAGPRQPRGEPGSRRAARASDLPARTRGRRSAGAVRSVRRRCARTPDCGRSWSPARPTPRTWSTPPSSTSTGRRDRAQRPGGHRPDPAGGRRPRVRCSRQGPISQMRAIIAEAARPSRCASRCFAAPRSSDRFASASRRC